MSSSSAEDAFELLQKVPSSAAGDVSASAEGVSASAEDVSASAEDPGLFSGEHAVLLLQKIRSHLLQKVLFA